MLQFSIIAQYRRSETVCLYALRPLKQLLDPSSSSDAHFRHWVKARHFSVVDLPVYNLTNVLMIPRTERKGDVARQDGDLLRVVHQEELYSVVKYVHDVHLVRLLFAASEFHVFEM